MITQVKKEIGLSPTYSFGRGFHLEGDSTYSVGLQRVEYGTEE